MFYGRYIGRLLSFPPNVFEFCLCVNDLDTSTRDLNKLLKKPA